jgi:hypothetical protein
MSLNSENKKQKKQLKQRVMKTKIRIFIVVCVLGFTTTLSAKATSNFRNTNNTMISEEDKNTKNVKTEESITTTDAVITIENNETISALLDRKSEKIDVRKEAQLVTKLTADKQEAKAVQKLIEEGKLTENK